MSFESADLRDALQGLPDTTRWLVGLSGGVDSVVLLHSLLSLELDQPIIAIHVNHGLSANAAQWEQHCRSLCDQWEVPLECCKVDVVNQGKGIEDAARLSRYNAMSQFMQQGDVLLLAHHQDDQAETMLFRLLRGAGPYGLSAMDFCRNFSQGYIARPLLNFSKESLRQYALLNELIWMEDDSNDDISFDRNYLRQQVMPVLEERWPGFASRWQRSAEACHQSDKLSHDLSLLDLERCDEIKERWGYSLCFASLSLLPRYRRNNLLRNWVRLRGFEIMERKHLEEADKQLFEAAVSGAVVQWANTALRLYSERLYLTPVQKAQALSTTLRWHGQAPLTLEDGSELHARQSFNGLRAKAEGYEVRWRVGGERCQPEGRRHSQTLKKLLQEYGLEPWLRDRVPLIYSDGELAAVGDLWVCKDFVAEDDEPAISLEWHMAD